MRTLLSVSGLTAILTFTAGCDPVLFSAEVEAPEVCINGLRVPFPPEGYTGSTDHPISGEDLGFPDTEEVDIKVEVRAVGIQPVAGVEDLSFLDTLSVSASPADPASPLDEAVLVEMGETDHQSDGGMFAKPESPVDIATFLRDGDVLFKFDLTGDLPDILWETEMDLCVHAVASYRKPL